MDPSDLTNAILPSLIGLFKESGEAAARKIGGAIGDTGMDKIRGLYCSLKANFKDDKPAGSALRNLRRNPSSQGGQNALRRVLETKIASDPEFAALLQQAVDEIYKSKGDTISQEITVSGGDVREVIQVGKITGV